MNRRIAFESPINSHINSSTGGGCPVARRLTGERELFGRASRATPRMLPETSARRSSAIPTGTQPELSLYSLPMAHRSPHHKKVSRRGVLKKAAAAGTAAVSISVANSKPAHAENATPPMPKNPFILCLNTSTIRGQKLPLPKEIDLAAKAGFVAIEPWVGEINDYVKAGGDLNDLKRRFADNGLAVGDAIGFAPWLMGEAEAHKKGLE